MLGITHSASPGGCCVVVSRVKGKHEFEQATCVSESGMERGYKKFPDVVGEEDRSLRESDF